MSLGKTKQSSLNFLGGAALAIACIASIGTVGTAYALSSTPPAVRSAKTVEPGEFTIQRGITDEDFRVPDRIDSAYEAARNAMEQGDLKSAVLMLRKVAEAGHFLAMHDLALFLRHEGTKESMAEAAVWYRRASEWHGVGFAGSQNNLGDVYETGEGLPKSPGDAIYWYTRSALQGEPTAYYSLGLCFADGFGVGKDLIEAYFWLSLAGRDLGPGANRDAAINRLKEIAGVMSEKDIAQAKAKANQFKPYYQTRMKIGDPPARTKSDTPAGGRE